MPNSRKRPPGLSVIAVILSLLAISGFLNAFIWAQLSASLPPEAPAHLRSGVNILASPAVSAAAILYAITALCAAAGIWRMSPWAPVAILTWGASVFILGGIFVVVGPQMVDSQISPLFLVCAGFGGAVVAIAIVTSTWLYVRRNVARVDL